MPTIPQSAAAGGWIRPCRCDRAGARRPGDPGAPPEDPPGTRTGVPRIGARVRSRSSRGRPHRELSMSLAGTRRSGITKLANGRRRVRRPVALQDPRSAVVGMPRCRRLSLTATGIPRVEPRRLLRLVGHPRKAFSESPSSLTVASKYSSRPTLRSGFDRRLGDREVDQVLRIYGLSEGRGRRRRLRRASRTSSRSQLAEARRAGHVFERDHMRVGSTPSDRAQRLCSTCSRIPEEVSSHRSTSSSGEAEAAQAWHVRNLLLLDPGRS